MTGLHSTTPIPHVYAVQVQFLFSMFWTSSSHSLSCPVVRSNLTAHSTPNMSSSSTHSLMSTRTCLYSHLLPMAPKSSPSHGPSSMRSPVARCVAAMSASVQGVNTAEQSCWDGSLRV